VTPNDLVPSVSLRPTVGRL